MLAEPPPQPSPGEPLTSQDSEFGVPKWLYLLEIGAHGNAMNQFHPVVPDADEPVDAGRLWHAASNAMDEAELLRRMRHALLTSVSWRVTAPLRATTAHLPAGVRRSLWRMARLSYWLVTPHRIPRRIALRQAMRLETSASPAVQQQKKVTPAAGNVPTSSRMPTTSCTFHFGAFLGRGGGACGD